MFDSKNVVVPVGNLREKYRPQKIKKRSKEKKNKKKNKRNPKNLFFHTQRHRNVTLEYVWYTLNISLS